LNPARDTAAHPALSLTIVLHNSADGLADCLRSIHDDVASGFADLIAVDNASPDQSADVLAEEIPEARIERSDRNRGFAGGANLAWPSVRASYWMLLNPDVIVPAGALRRLVAWMDAHPSIAFASPELRAPDGRPGTPGRALPSVGLTLLELSRLHRLLPARLRGRLLRGAYWTGGDQLDAGWVPGTALIARREAVEAIGLLSESFFMYGEDLDWCWRARSAGWSIGVCSGVTVTHREGSSATRTWAPEESVDRTDRALFEAIWRTRGRRYATLYIWVNALALSLEGIHPRRSSAERRRARNTARAYRSVLRDRRRWPRRLSRRWPDTQLSSPTRPDRGWTDPRGSDDPTSRG
jgi:N-acetylglucosaminyl-diphospho-decaprenol L-rhamnosyltransferase